MIEQEEVKIEPEETITEPKTQIVQEPIQTEPTLSKENLNAHSKLNKEKTNWMKVLLKGV